MTTPKHPFLLFLGKNNESPNKIELSLYIDIMYIFSL